MVEGGGSKRASQGSSRVSTSSWPSSSQIYGQNLQLSESRVRVSLGDTLFFSFAKMKKSQEIIFVINILVCQIGQQVIIQTYLWTRGLTAPRKGTCCPHNCAWRGKVAPKNISALQKRCPASRVIARDCRAKEPAGGAGDAGCGTARLHEAATPPWYLLCSHLHLHKSWQKQARSQSLWYSTATCASGE